MADRLKTTIRYYGISPWEIEVLYGLLDSHFEVIQEEEDPFDEDYVSVLEASIPLEFSAAFFEWFTFKRWEKVKAIFKEMKRRRGSGNAIRVTVRFAGNPGISFRVDARDRQWFDNALEKMDFVLELLPYHLDPSSLPGGTDTLEYVFDSSTTRWRRDRAGGRRFRDGAWS
ncbi:MAG: hypothetical protein MPI95_04015 [Nitrosopumilus sp.]|nr:hypothetical protein [Nitrosopumilus sp.]